MLPALILVAQLGAAAPPEAAPVLAFPEPGLDDTAAYAGYRTRFFRDAAGNTVQLYVDPRAGRTVHLWADAENASAGFTARDPRGARGDAPLGAVRAPRAAREGRARTLEHRLVAAAPAVSLGWFVLGSMRVERDLQYAGTQRGAFGPRFPLPEIDAMLARMDALPPAERARHVAALGAADVRTLRRASPPGSRWRGAAARPSRGWSSPRSTRATRWRSSSRSIPRASRPPSRGTRSSCGRGARRARCRSRCACPPPARRSPRSRATRSSPPSSSPSSTRPAPPAEAARTRRACGRGSSNVRCAASS
jgi:hypothetical protein